MVTKRQRGVRLSVFKLQQALDAQRKYLVGRSYLDRARTEPNLLRAMTEFESAIRLDSDYLLAHAGLCEALVMDHIRTGSIAHLNEAEPLCLRALKLDGNNKEAKRAMAYLDRKAGRLAKSVLGFTEVLDQSPNNVDALLGISEAYLIQQQRGEADDAFAKAYRAVSLAADIEPNFWKIDYLMARVEYLGGDLQAAIAAIQRAVDKDANLQTLSNLGTF